MSTAGKVLTLAALGGLALVVLGARAAAQTPPSSAPEPSPAPVERAADAGESGFPSVTVTGEMREHQRWIDALYFGGTAYSMLALLGILAFGVSRRLRDAALRVTSRPFLAAMVFFALFSVVLTVATLPFDALSGFVVPHRFDLSNQSFGAWLWEQGKGLLLGIVLGAPLVALALAGIRRVRRWWLALWLGTVPITVFLLLVGPVVLDPVFNRFEPLKDQVLKAEILDLAAQAGIEGGRVYEVDKSKQTRTMNAYVNGIGPTKRIVLWDTTIKGMTRDEVRFVMAHEMAHYVLHHVWKELGFILALFLAVFWAGQRGVEWATGRWGRAWGFEVPHDPAAVPLLLLAVSLGVFLVTPAINGVSRHFEHEADTFALELTHLNRDGAQAFVKLAENSKVLPQPSAFIRFWRYSHPPLAERIVFCRDYHPWTEGLANRVWLGGTGTGPAGS